MNDIAKNTDNIFQRFNELECSEFYITSFIDRSMFNDNFLIISGCNNILKREKSFTLEKDRGEYSVSFRENNLEESYPLKAEVFYELISQLKGLGEMRSRIVSSISPLYGSKRSLIKLS